MLALADAPHAQRAAAETYVRVTHAGRPRVAAKLHSGERLRIGYYSPDFREHPVSYLSVGLLEAHDRNAFEVTAFAFGPGSDGETRRRVVAASDAFIDVAAMGDSEAASLSRELGIDIAIDLAGHTRNSRMGIFAYGAAPLQASYLGYLGTLGAPFFDYLLADPVIVPGEMRSSYSEKIAYLRTYFARDVTRPMAARPSREALGLPRGTFVFCCFNNAYKISPESFASWMRILQRTEGSVLWLVAREESVRARLRDAARSGGVEPDRLIFAGPVPRAEYLARLREADLFLDTWPYNAGTVASDALAMGLPVLTLCGQSFASRVGASLLDARGLRDLITNSAREYEDRAVALRLDAELVLGFRARLSREPEQTEANVFCRSLESLYRDMHSRHRNGLAPDHLFAKDLAR
jgi:protein O-GlcNAc transferase